MLGMDPPDVSCCYLRFVLSYDEADLFFKCIFAAISEIKIDYFRIRSFFIVFFQLKIDGMEHYVAFGVHF